MTFTFYRCFILNSQSQPVLYVHQLKWNLACLGRALVMMDSLYDA